MYFTVNLRSEENECDDFSYGLAFVPCPVWVKGDEILLNLHPEYPHYRLGGIKRLIEQEGIGEKLPGAVCAHVIVHPVGYGTAADLATLQSDLEAEGFTVVLCGQIDDSEASDPKAP
jgi:hypothetical protein